MIAKFCNFFGLNDRFAIIKGEFAEKYFTRLDYLDCYIKNGGIFHPETFLLHIFSTNNVYRTNVCFETLRPDFTTDPPVYEKRFGDIV
jgi:hypothetical protein